MSYDLGVWWHWATVWRARGDVERCVRRLREEQQDLRNAGVSVEQEANLRSIARTFGLAPDYASEDSFVDLSLEGYLHELSHALVAGVLVRVKRRAFEAKDRYATTRKLEAHFDRVYPLYEHGTRFLESLPADERARLEAEERTRA